MISRSLGVRRVASSASVLFSRAPCSATQEKSDSTSGGGSTCVPAVTDRMVLTKSSIVASSGINPETPSFMNSTRSFSFGRKSTMTWTQGDASFIDATMPRMSELPEDAPTRTTSGLASRTWRMAAPRSAAAPTILRPRCAPSAVAIQSRSNRLPSMSSSGIFLSISIVYRNVRQQVRGRITRDVPFTAVGWEHTCRPRGVQ